MTHYEFVNTARQLPVGTIEMKGLPATPWMYGFLFVPKFSKWSSSKWNLRLVCLLHRKSLHTSDPLLSDYLYQIGFLICLLKFSFLIHLSWSSEWETNPNTISHNWFILPFSFIDSNFRCSTPSLDVLWKVSFQDWGYPGEAAPAGSMT